MGGSSGGGFKLEAHGSYRAQGKLPGFRPDMGGAAALSGGEGRGAADESAGAEIQDLIGARDHWAQQVAASGMDAPKDGIDPGRTVPVRRLAESRRPGGDIQVKAVKILGNRDVLIPAVGYACVGADHRPEQGGKREEGSCFKSHRKRSLKDYWALVTLMRKKRAFFPAMKEG